MSDIVERLRRPDILLYQYAASVSDDGALLHEAADEIERLRIAMVQSVLPLEAMLLVGNTQLKLAPELWEGIEKGVAAVRATLGEKE